MTAPTRTLPDAWEGSPIPPRRWQAEALPILRQALARRSRFDPSRVNRPIAYAIMGSGKSVLMARLAWLALQSLPAGEVIVIAAPRQNLVKQLGETVRKFCGLSEVGLFYADTKQPAKRIVVCCYPSLLTLVSELSRLGRKVRLFIADEAHRTACETVDTAWTLLAPTYAVGFTATPYLADKRASIELFDEVAYTYDMTAALADGVLVPPIAVELDAAWMTEIGTQGVDALDRACLRLLAEAQARDLPLWPCISSAYDIEDAEHFADVLRGAGYTVDTVHSKRPKDDNARAVKRLLAGDVQILVQVTMLAEGSDYPSLRSLILRRHIASDVLRFQFMGRGIRSHPGKSFCVMLDPHLQLRVKGVATRPEALGPAMELLAAEEAARIAAGGSAPKEPREIQLAFVDRVEAWTGETLGLMAAHPAFRVSQFERGTWRDSRPSERQIAALEGLRWTTQYLPEHARKPVRALLDARELLPSGAVSDLLALLFAISSATKPIRDAAAKHVAETGSHPHKPRSRAHKPRWTWPEDLTLSPVPPAPTTRQQEAIHAAR